MFLQTCNNKTPIVHQDTLIHIIVCSIDIQMVLINFDVKGILIIENLPLFGVYTNLRFALFINTNTMLHMLIPLIFDLQWLLFENQQQTGLSHFDKLST